MGRCTKLPIAEFETAKLAANYPECGYCKNKLIIAVGEGEFARICKKRLQCADFTPRNDEQAK